MADAGGWPDHALYIRVNREAQRCLSLAEGNDPALLHGRIVLDLRPEDIYWCTADPGWVTGTSYGIFAPWLNGVTNIVRGGRFSPRDWYRTIERFAVTVWYSAPTAFRMLMGAGENSLQGADLGSLRHVLSVGEPLNPEVVRWGIRCTASVSTIRGG